MLREKDYKECRFIDEEMRFYTFEEFVINANAIKRLYSVLNCKLFYKWYVYSHIMGMRRKDKIWEFLNGDIELEELNNA